VKKITIVIPVYCESQSLKALHERLQRVVGLLPEYSWEYIFVNDGSTDNSFDVIGEICNIDPTVKAIDLSRNFGKEIALTAGVLEALNSDAVICIDADLQHPPELIPQLISFWKSGVDVVITVRTESKNQSLIRKAGSAIYYLLMSRLSDLQMVAKTTDFGLYDAKVIQSFSRITERRRIFRGIIDWMGFRRAFVEFTADERHSGEAKYSFTKLWGLAVNSITSFSLWPLRIAGYLGIIITSISALILIWMLIDRMLGSKLAFTSLAIVVMANTFLMGIVLIAIGLVALYIGNIHTEVINRPLYIIRERLSKNSEKQ
jgi:dolichol-phosphate mannosyltransferase